jgi:hypothetical protein
MLRPLMGNSPHHFKISIEFSHTLSSLLAGPEDILVSFHVVSLFAKMPIRKTVDLMGGHPGTLLPADRWFRGFIQ